MFSVRGLRPTAIRMRSVSIFCGLPSTLKVTVTPDLPFSIFSTFVPVWKAMPRLR